VYHETASRFGQELSGSDEKPVTDGAGGRFVECLAEIVCWSFGIAVEHLAKEAHR
jgi:hypothetical protein